MTRLKKELKYRGFKFDEDYLYLPWDNHGHAPALEGVSLRILNDHIEILEFYVVGTIIRWIGKDLEEDLDKQIFD